MRFFCALFLAALAARGEKLQDDPAGRARARALADGPRTPESQLQILRAARQLAQAPLASTAVAGSAWVNLGPASADFDKNEFTYHSVDSGRARKVLVDPRDPDVVYLATSGGGVWKTFNALAPIDATGGGPTWQPITDNIGSLAIGSLAMDPSNPDILLLGLGDPFDVKSPGFLRSADGGATWSDPVLLSDNAGGPIASSVRDIAIDPANSAAVLVATDVGLFRSDDGGTTFTLIVLDIIVPQEAWSIGFVGGQTWLVTTIDAPVDPSQGGTGKLWRSTNGGVSFDQIIVPDFGSPPDVARMTLATSASDRATPSSAFVYLVANNNTSAPDQKDLFQSINGGATWIALHLGPGKPPINLNTDQPDTDVLHDQAWYNQMLLVDPVDHSVVFLGGNLSMIRSLDAGVNWEVLSNWLPQALNSQTWPATAYVHADLHAGAIAHTAGGNYLYVGSDGGLFRSTNDFLAGGVPVWENKLNRGIVTHLIYSVVTGSERAATNSCPVGAGAEDLILGGFQDNGTRFRASGSPTVFNQIQGGDGFGVGLGCATGGANGSLLLSTYASQISASRDGGQTFNVSLDAASIGIQLDSGYTFVMRVAADLTDPKGQTFLTPLTDTAKQGYVFRTTNGGASWNNLNGTIHLTSGTTASLFPAPVRDVQADPVHPGHYAAVTTVSAYVSIDAGANWVETIPLGKDPTGDYVHPHTIAFDPSDATGKTIWAGSRSMVTAVSSAPVGCHLFKSVNALAGSGATWLNRCTSGLPNVPVNIVKLDPGNASTVYAGTEIGLFRSQNGGASWSRYGTGLPLVSVTDIAISANEGAVRVATFGRGFWEISNAAGGSLHGALGNGDFDRNQLIDGTDLIREAALLLTDSTSDSYDAIGNLTGATNAIDGADLTALLAKFGSRP